MMTTADMALRIDPAYEKISRRFMADPQAFADAFARAWFKLTHRDMGPRARYLGPLVPAEELIWQDPIPAVDHPLVDDADVAALKAHGAGVGPADRAAGGARPGRRHRRSAAATSAAAPTARASASRRRRTGRRTSRRSSPRCSRRSKRIQRELQRRAVRRQEDLAGRPDRAGRQRGGRGRGAARPASDVAVPFTPGRMDASQAQTDVALVRAAGAAGRRLPQLRCAPGLEGHVAELLVDKAQLLTLTAPEMTVLVGGLRVLDANVGHTRARRVHHSVRARCPTTSSSTCWTCARAGRSRPPRACWKAAIARPAS